MSAETARALSEKLFVAVRTVRGEAPSLSVRALLSALFCEIGQPMPTLLKAKGGRPFFSIACGLSPGEQTPRILPPPANRKDCSAPENGNMAGGRTPAVFAPEMRESPFFAPSLSHTERLCACALLCRGEPGRLPDLTASAGADAAKTDAAGGNPAGSGADFAKASATVAGADPAKASETRSNADLAKASETRSNADLTKAFRAETLPAQIFPSPDGRPVFFRVALPDPTPAESLRPLRVGVDIEATDRFPLPRLFRLANRYFTPGEQAVLHRETDPVRAFYEIFTAKEAYGKWTGRGLAAELRADVTRPESLGVHFFRCQVG
ncbi:MAG: 4'-phosphopantetheinyl transferase superfamily protein, partial [Eubacteriales bacterium]|nr:4'-phosphopantetheinyl transferase superfamily protein [Eubacteriales bacterium]